jgi:starch synthase
MFSQRLMLDGIEKKDVKTITNTEIDYVSLSKLAVDFSDGVIQASEKIHPEVVAYVEEKKKAFLPYPGAENFVDSYCQLYESLL